MSIKKVGIAALSLVTVAGITACGPDEGAEVDHATARQAIEANTLNMGARISGSLKFLEASTLFETGLGASGSAFGGSNAQLCEAIYDEAGMFAGEDCSASEEPSTGGPSFDSDLNEEAQELARVLNERVFAEGNIESETSASVTYLIRGPVFCDASEGGSGPIAPGEEDPAPGGLGGLDPECVQEVDDAQIRLVVTSPVSGDIDIAVQVGPQRHSPLFIELHSSSLAAEIDLAAAKGALQHLSSVRGGEGPELPATMVGRIRAELLAPSDTQLDASLSILQAVDVADGDYTVQIGVSEPAFLVQIDGAAKSVQTTSNQGGLDAAFPIYDDIYTYDDATGAETVTESTMHVALHIPAMNQEMLFDAVAELVTGSLSLSDTATFSIDGNEVLAIDLNESAGRSLSFSAKESANGGAELAVEPSFDLKATMNFARAVNHLDEFEEWMLNDVLHIKLDGAAKPTLRIQDGQTEVVEGALTMSLDNDGATLTVAAGQCLVGIDDAPVIDADGNTVEQPSLNPVEELSAGTCG